MELHVNYITPHEWYKDNIAKILEREYDSLDSEKADDEIEQ